MLNRIDAVSRFKEVRAYVPRIYAPRCLRRAAMN